jgi:hypothetical protein
MAKHNGPVWKEATEAIFNHIKTASTISSPMKATMLANLEFIVRHAVSRIIENLGHDEIGSGFERVVGEDGKVKFTYDQSNKGKTARKKEAIRWMKIYAQTDHGSGKRRGRVSLSSFDMGGDTEAGEESNWDVSDEELAARVTQNEKGKWKALANNSDWHGSGHSRHDIIRRQRGTDLAEANKKWEKNENNIQNKLNQEIAKWLNNNPGKIITHVIVDDLLEKMFKDKEWLKEKGLDHINPETITDELETIKAIATKSSTEEVPDVRVDPTVGLALDNETQQYFDLFKDLAEKGTVAWRGQELSLNTVRDEGLLEHFKELYENTKKRIEESSIDEIEKNSLLKSLKSYWDKIDVPAAPKTMTTKLAIPTDVQMEQLRGLKKLLEDHAELRPVQRKIMMKNLEVSYKKNGGIQEYLKQFDKAAENKPFLKTMLELIRNKLNEFQKVA